MEPPDEEYELQDKAEQYLESQKLQEEEELSQMGQFRSRANSQEMANRGARLLRQGRSTFVPTIISVILLGLAAVSGWPYFFYVLLRLVVCMTAIYLALEARKLYRTAWIWLMGSAALLFNPIFPIGMARDDWQVLDLIRAVLFLVSLRGIRVNASHHTFPKLAGSQTPD